MKYAEMVREFIINNFLYGDGAALQDDTSFLESGTVDSTGMLELIMFLEETFAIKVEPHEMVPENLDNINRVAAFISRKIESVSASGVSR